MGCGTSIPVIKTDQRIKCPRHPNSDLNFFDKEKDTFICQYCRRHYHRQTQVVNLLTFVNSSEFSEKVSDAYNKLTTEIRDLKEHDQNLAYKRADIKEGVNNYIEDTIKLLRQLKSDLYCDVEKTMTVHRESLRKRLKELEGFNNTFRACRAQKTRDARFSLLKSCSEYKQSTPVDSNLKYNLENNSVIQGWQNRHDVFLQPPYPDSMQPNDQRATLPSSAGSEYSSDDSGHLEIGFGSRMSDAKAHFQSHTEDTQTNDQFAAQTSRQGKTKPGNTSRSAGGPISTARLSKIQVSSELECVKTLQCRGRKITCSIGTANGNVIFCDQMNSELLLLDSELRPLRSKHLSGRPIAVRSESMRVRDWMVVDYKRQAFRASALSYEAINYPRCVAVDGEDNIYVVGKRSEYVHMISGAGIYKGFALVMDSPIVHFSYLPALKAFLVVTQNGERVDVYREIEDSAF